MKDRIYRNFFWFALITIFVVSFVSVLFFNRAIHEQKETGMKEEADFMTALLEKEELSRESFEAAARNTKLRITLIDPDGTILFDNRVEDVSVMGNHSHRPEIEAAERFGEGRASRVSDTLRSETFYYAVRLQDGKILRLSSEGMSIWTCFVQLLPLLLAVAAAVFLIAFLTAHMLTNHIAGVINDIDLEEPLKVIQFPELATLQKRLDHQNRKVRVQLQDLREQERKFTAITQNMNEGLIMLDMDRNIVYLNQSCRNLFGVSGRKFEGQHISAFYSSEQLNEVIDTAFRGEGYTATQKLGEKKIQYFGNPVMQKKSVSGIIILVMDITERERTEKMRKEFSANVSHELKTPLTSISGYAELMENNMVRPEDVPEFASKIRKEASRLLTLVNDIIKVSQLDDQDIFYTKENVNLFELAEEIKQRLEPAAKQAEVTVSVKGEAVRCLASRQMMNDLLYNLIENGIKYNRKGGEVHVTVCEKKERPCICVRDTGIGVPMKYQSRIFERFFRVDKSHSKQTGGTGLGLSIVKHVVDYYGGYIEIHSTPGEGTEIITYL